MDSSSKQKTKEKKQKMVNSVFLRGYQEGETVYSHTVVTGESFYKITLAIPRLSGIMDHVMVMVRERTLKEQEFYKGILMDITGMMRSYNRIQENGAGTRLEVYVLANRVETYPHESLAPEISSNNIISICGEIEKMEPFLRDANGEELLNVMLVIHRQKNANIKLPCVAWNRIGNYILRSCNIGEKVFLNGRLQSRVYKERETEKEREIVELTIFHMLNLT